MEPPDSRHSSFSPLAVRWPAPQEQAAGEAANPRPRGADPQRSTPNHQLLASFNEEGSDCEPGNNDPETRSQTVDQGHLPFAGPAALGGAPLRGGVDRRPSYSQCSPASLVSTGSASAPLLKKKEMSTGERGRSSFPAVSIPCCKSNAGEIRRALTHRCLSRRLHREGQDL